MAEEKKKITTQRIYTDDVERVLTLAQYGKPFRKALGRVLDRLEAFEEEAKGAKAYVAPEYVDENNPLNS